VTADIQVINRCRPGMIRRSAKTACLVVNHGDDYPRGCAAIRAPVSSRLGMNAET
jgi:hypothetical protein